LAEAAPAGARHPFLYFTKYIKSEKQEDPPMAHAIPLVAVAATSVES
jgi:hypothetical protein